MGADKRIGFGHKKPGLRLSVSGRTAFGDMDRSKMKKPIELVSSRLRLIALTPELAALQKADRMAFFKALEVEPEPSWPPELFDVETMAAELADHPDDTGWYSWVYISPVMHRLLGCGGFKGAPDAEGRVEIGYSMLTSYREQGLATEGVNALTGWAYQDDRVKHVIANTPADRDASHRVLEKAGFVQTGTFRDEADNTDMIGWINRPSQAAA
jgi:[ribosomal protein S5]-alanine N-acetyltransferase